MSGKAITLRMRAVAHPTSTVAEITFESMAGIDLPPWEPGAHVEVSLPSGLVRHYSLLGDIDDRRTYRIAVLRELAGRGGSAEMHEIAAAGLAMPVRPPKNNFALEPAQGYLFLAGGIGITPILPMLQKAQRDGIPWRLVYGGRSREHMAYVERLIETYPLNVSVFADDAEGRPDFEALLSSAAPGTLVYACGPTPMLDLVAALVEAHEEWPAELRLERFNVAAVDTAGEPFEVELARTGVTIPIASDGTILRVMQARGLTAPFSCENGYCGTCEAVVLDGLPDHRDTYLSDEEKDDSFTMMICVSRCVGDRLVLDL